MSDVVNPVFALPEGLRLEQIQSVDCKLSERATDGAAAKAAHRVSVMLDEVMEQAVQGNEAALDALVRIDPAFRPPRGFNEEWCRDVHWRLTAIELASEFFEWSAVTAAGIVPLPPQKPQTIAALLRRPEFEADMRKKIGVVISYTFHQEKPN
jgi:hypothetical protein